MKHAILIASALALAACASIVDEKTQVVTVEAPWCHAASCTLRNDGGAYYAKSVPESLVINKSEEDLVMVCEAGERSSVTTFESTANGYMTAGNILLFGGITRDHRGRQFWRGLRLRDPAAQRSGLRRPAQRGRAGALEESGGGAQAAGSLGQA